MEIVIKLTDSDLKDNLVLSTINTLFKSEKAIKAPNTDFEDITPDWANNAPKSNENTQKSKGKTKEEDVEKEVQKLKDFANGIYKQLNEKSQKSLKKFVEFYTDKIVNNGFRINPEKQFKIWTERDLNLK